MPEPVEAPRVRPDRPTRPVPTTFHHQTPSTTLPPSEPEVMLEAPPAVRTAQQDAGQGRQDAAPDGGQARPGRRSGLGPCGGFFPPQPPGLQEGEGGPGKDGGG